MRSPNRLRARAGLVLLLLGILTFGTGPHARGGTEAEDVPEENSSVVSTETPWLRRLVEAAHEEMRAGRWRAAVRALQVVIEAREDAERPGASAPYVQAVRGVTVYEGAWIWARNQILAAGEPAVGAYREEFGSTARDLLARATASRDPGGLTEVADRFLILPEGRRAALRLADLAVERGDRDAALRWLERLEDIEEVSVETPTALAPWREARIRRTAVALARPGKIEEAEAFLREQASPGTPVAERFAPLPAAWRQEVPPLRDWPTPGGEADRNGCPTEVDGSALAYAWRADLAGGPLDGAPARIDLGGDRPSPWIPPRAAFDGHRAFVFDGSHVYVWDVSDGRLAAEPTEVPSRVGHSLGLDRMHDLRDELGLLEGHAVTLGPRYGGGRLVYLAAPDPFAEAGRWDYDQLRDDRLEALFWDGRRFRRLWRTGGLQAHGGMPRGVRLYGAPLLYRDRLWMAGVRRAQGTADQAEAWLFALDPFSGRVALRTYLGAGTPVRAQRADEAIPSSPAAARGRVVVSTALGIVAAVDASDGRVQWMLRYERGAVGSGRPRRLSTERDEAPRQSGFVNQAPKIALERVVVAPTDGPWIYTLFDRPRGRERGLVGYAMHRRYDFRNFAAEQIAGIHPGTDGGRPRLIVVGKGASAEGDVPAPMIVALDALVPTRPPLWTAASTTGYGAEPYGEAVMTSTEVLVPTRHGIVVVEVGNGRVRATLDTGGLPKDLLSHLATGAVPYGNLLPLPGMGILAVNQRLVTCWRRPDGEGGH